QMPRVPKLSAGYFSSPEMDLIDLFIGAEGTLGVITEVTLRVLPTRPAAALAFVTFADRAAAIDCASNLRTLAHEAWRTGRGDDTAGIDVAAIEYLDARSLRLVREDAADRANNVSIPVDAVAALLVRIELSPGMTPARAFEEIAASTEGEPKT